MMRNKASKTIAIGALIYFIAATQPEAFGIVIDKIVAVVNGEVITQREVTRLLIPIYEQYRKEYTGKRLEGKMQEAEESILNQLIDDKLILSEARSQDIEATEKEIEAKLQAIKGRFETEDGFREALVEQNISLSELRDRCRDDVIKSKLVRKEMGLKAAVSPIEVKQYYDDHIDEFAETEKVQALHILFKKDKNGRTKSEARSLAEKIRALIENGDEFEELVLLYSEAGNAGGDGSLGLIERGQMIEEIDSALFSLGEGEVSDIVESPMGYHIFKVTEKIPVKYLDFETAKYDIEELLYRNKVGSHIINWLEELRKNAYISIK